jgi:flagellar biogenesis protein FliO
VSEDGGGVAAVLLSVFAVFAFILFLGWLNQ